MPRAKVRDEDRQRARKACIPCKSSKIRCDANQPCGGCVKKNRRSECRFLSPSKTAQGQSGRPSKTPRLSDDHIYATSTSCSDRDLSEKDEPAERRGPEAIENGRSRPIQSTHASSPRVTHSRMLLSSKGEKMYIGNYSHLSLLHFLRQTVRVHIGPSAFSEAAARDVMLEADMDDFDEIDIDAENFGYKESLLQYFSEVSVGLLDVCAEGEVYNFLSISSRKPQGGALCSDDRAVLYLIMAIGAQCKGDEPFDVKFASTCFSRARHLAFQGFLCDPTTRMVRVFVLMAFYMLGACRRNAAFMYLGVASKAAVALGLHSRSQHLNLSKFEQDLRLRIWKSLYVLDTLTNLLLGRPGTLPRIKLESLHQRNNVKDQQPKTRRLDASYGACIHIATIVPKMSQSNGLDSSATEAFLKSLGKWRETALPSDRNHTFGMASLPAIETSEEKVGDLHVACIYYFAVILVTKPFLLSHLTHTLRRRTTNKQDAQVSDLPVDERVAKLGQACIDASGYMTQSCETVMMTGGLKDNMVILLAFMFSAGLLLGYSNFVDGKASECMEAFRSSQAVLKKFSTLSPQARHYHEILRDFDSAVTKYQQLQQHKRRLSTGRYVKPVFSIETDRETGHSAYPTPSTGSDYFNANTTGLPAILDSGENSYLGNIDLMNAGATDMNDATGFVPETSGLLNSMDMPLLWDDVDFDWQVFSAFPDEVNIGM